MDSMNVDTEVLTAPAAPDQDSMGETCFMELRNVRNAYVLGEPRSISKILEAVGLYNGFGIEHTVVLSANSATRARVFLSTSSSAHIVLRTFPDEGRATVCIYVCMGEPGRRNMFFAIYDFLTQAFSSDYDSACISFVEH
jgi:S-adenosylmethionine/arginine decarboxylase-like enzyme